MATATKPKAKAKTTRARSTAKAPRAKAASRPAPTAEPQGVGEVAERAVLIPVGAALMARDRIVTGVSDTLSTYSSPPEGAGADPSLRASRRDGAQARRTRDPQDAGARRA